MTNGAFPLIAKSTGKFAASLFSNENAPSFLMRCKHSLQTCNLVLQLLKKSLET